jgi:hypothetical protein
MSKRLSPPRRPSPVLSASSGRFVIDVLEARYLLSTITWTNRGQTSDGFAAVFGTNANLARSVIDAVITSWEREIVNFNYPGGGDTYDVTISTAVANTGQGAATSITESASNGSPEAATINVLSGTDGHGGGYFLDPNPLASTAFIGSTTNAYAAYAPSSSPAYGLGDLYELVLHEMGHAMGFDPNANTEKYSFNTNVVDTADSSLGGVNPPVGHYWAFHGPDGNLLVTDFNDLGNEQGQEDSGPVHYAYAGAQVTSGGITYYGSDDLMVPYYSYDQRRQISRDDLIFLKDSYGYTVQTADYYGTAYDELDSNGELHISVPGTGGNVISVVNFGGNLTVTMTLGSPVVGADPSVLTSYFLDSSVSSVDIVGGPGNDTIALNSVGANVPVTIVGGGGDDTVTLVNSGPSTTLETSEVYGSNVDVALMTGITTLNVDGSASDNTYTIYSSPVVAGGQINIEGSAANDYLTYGGITGIAGLPSINFDGFGGVNSVEIDNSGATGVWQFTLTDSRLTSYGPNLYSRADTFSSISGYYQLRGGGTGDTYYLENSAPADVVDVDGYGANNVYYAEGDQGQLNIFGAGSSDSAYEIDSTSSAVIQAYSVMSNTSDTGEISDATLALNAVGVGALTLDSSGGNDTTTIDSLPPFAVYLNEGAGSNAVGFGTFQLPSFSYGLNVTGNTGGGTSLTLNNSGGDGDPVTTLSANTFSIGSGTLSYAMLGALIYTGSFQSTLDVIGTAAQTAYTLNAYAGGNSLVNIGVGNISNIVTGASPITIDGAELLTVNDQSDLTGRNYTLTRTGISVAGLFVLDDTSSGSGISVLAGAGNDIITVAGSDGVGESINGGLGDDAFYVGSATTSLLNAFPGLGGYGGVTVAGGGGSDSLDVIDPAEDSLPVSAGEVGPVYSGAQSAAVFYSGFAMLAINHGDSGSGGSIVVNSTAPGTPVTVVNSSGYDPIDVVTTDPTAPVTIQSNTGVDPVTIGPTGTTTGTAVADFTTTQTIGLLTLNNGGTAVVPSVGTRSGRKVLTVGGLDIGGNGTLDLMRNDLIVQGGSVSTVTAEVASGFNLAGGGKWNGAGITSSAAAGDTTHLTALGTIVNNDGAGHALYGSSNLFDGVAPALNDVLVKFTYFGDANLDGKVDGSDYTLIDSAYATDKPAGGTGPLTGWYHGDFNYDKSIDGSDYSLIDNAFNSQGAHLVAPAAEVAATTGSVASPIYVPAAGTPVAKPVWSSRAITATLSTGSQSKRAMMEMPLSNGLALNSVSPAPVDQPKLSVPTMVAGSIDMLHWHRKPPGIAANGDSFFDSL